MIDSESLFRWGAGFLIGTGFIDFFRFGTFKLQTDDWLSVGMASAGLTMVTLAAIDMTLERKMLKLNAPSDYENIYLENTVDANVIDEMAGLSVEN
ncbi:MAG: hypothetical protein ACTSPB_01820 [Candidatus Thorarchaeota archaeon]